MRLRLDITRSNAFHMYTMGAKDSASITRHNTAANQKPRRTVLNTPPTGVFRGSRVALVLAVDVLAVRAGSPRQVLPC